MQPLLIVGGGSGVMLLHPGILQLRPGGVLLLPLHALDVVVVESVVQNGGRRVHAQIKAGGVTLSPEEGLAHGPVCGGEEDTWARGVLTTGEACGTSGPCRPASPRSVVGAHPKADLLKPSHIICGCPVHSLL